MSVSKKKVVQLAVNTENALSKLISKCNFQGLNVKIQGIFDQFKGSHLLSSIFKGPEFSIIKFKSLLLGHRVNPDINATT